MPIGVYTEAKARWILRELQKLVQQPPARVGEGRPPVIDDDGIPFQNTGAITITAYGLMRVDSSVVSNGFPIPTCKRPDAEWRDYWLVNGPTDVEANEFGVAQRGPLVTFAYDGTVGAYETLGPKPGQCEAVKDYPALLRISAVVDAEAKWARGFLLPITTLLAKSQRAIAVGSMTTDGTDWLICKGAGGTAADAGFTTMPAAETRDAIDNATFFKLIMVNNRWESVTGGETKHKLVKTTTTHGAGGTATVNIWTGAPGSEAVTSPLQTLNATNRTSVAIPSGKFCLATNINGNWYIEPWEC